MIHPLLQPTTLDWKQNWIICDIGQPGNAADSGRTSADLREEKETLRDYQINYRVLI